MIYSNQPGNAPGNAPYVTRRLVESLEAAAILSISPRTLWTLTNEGDLPCVRIGRSVRYDLRDLDAWIERHKSAGRASALNASSAGDLPPNNDPDAKENE